jgi:hypothetical protein
MTKKTKITFVMATLCLNFCYGQPKSKSPIDTTATIFKYGFTGFKSGYPSGYRMNRDAFGNYKTITVRNYTITQLFAVALGAGRQIREEAIMKEVREPKKLDAIYCYKLMVPAWQADNFYIIMQQNLNLEFRDYQASMEERNGKYYMVIRDKEY